MSRPVPSVHENLERRVVALKCGLLAAWAMIAFGGAYFARDLALVVLGWPLNYWFAAQGCMLVFIAIVVVYAVVMGRWNPHDDDEEEVDV